MTPFYLLLYVLLYLLSYLRKPRFLHSIEKTLMLISKLSEIQPVRRFEINSRFSPYRQH